MKRVLEDRIESFSHEEAGNCSCCGKEWIKVVESDANPVIQNFRFRKPGDSKTGWSFFRCKCQADLEENFDTAHQKKMKKSLLQKIFS